MSDDDEEVSDVGVEVGVDESVRHSSSTASDDDGDDDDDVVDDASTADVDTEVDDVDVDDVDVEETNEVACTRPLLPPLLLPCPGTI